MTAADHSDLNRRTQPAGTAGQSARWWRAAGVWLPLGLTVLTFALGYLQKAKCHVAGWPRKGELLFGQYCYSDIAVLLRERGLIDGRFPYAPQPGGQHELEYPVLTGLVMDLTARVSLAFAPGTDVAAASRAYFTVNVLLLLGFALATVAGVWVLLRHTGGRPTDALLVAGAPTLALAGTINWDLVPVALTVFALLAWAHERPLVAGVLIGLGTAAKLYPMLLLGPLFVLCLRQRRMRAFWTATAAAVAALVLVNLPVALRYPEGWAVFFRFNSDRPADHGTLWLWLERVGLGVPALNVVAPLTLVALCAGIAWLIWRAPVPPRFAQVAFLVVAAFLVTNKVYSPQYVLWMLPLVVLARGHLPFRPVLRAFVIWQAAEVFYWAMVWAWLNGDGGLYDLSIFLRLAATGYLCAEVIRDIQRPPADQLTGTYGGIGTSAQLRPSRETNAC